MYIPPLHYIIFVCGSALKALSVSLDAEQLLDSNNSPSSCVHPVPLTPLLWLLGLYHLHHHTHTIKDVWLLETFQYILHKHGIYPEFFCISSPLFPMTKQQKKPHHCWWGISQLQYLESLTASITTLKTLIYSLPLHSWTFRKNFPRLLRLTPEKEESKKAKKREKKKKKSYLERHASSPPPLSSSAQLVYTTKAKYISVWIDWPLLSQKGLSWWLRKWRGIHPVSSRVLGLSVQELVQHLYRNIRYINKQGHLYHWVLDGINVAVLHRASWKK